MTHSSSIYTETEAFSLHFDHWSNNRRHWAFTPRTPSSSYSETSPMNRDTHPHQDGEGSGCSALEKEHARPDSGCAGPPCLSRMFRRSNRCADSPTISALAWLPRGSHTPGADPICLLSDGSVVTHTTAPLAIFPDKILAIGNGGWMQTHDRVFHLDAETLKIDDVVAVEARDMPCLVSKTNVAVAFGPNFIVARILGKTTHRFSPPSCQRGSSSSASHPTHAPVVGVAVLDSADALVMVRGQKVSLFAVDQQSGSLVSTWEWEPASAPREIAGLGGFSVAIKCDQSYTYLVDTQSKMIRFSRTPNVHIFTYQACVLNDGTVATSCEPETWVPHQQFHMGHTTQCAAYMPSAGLCVSDGDLVVCFESGAHEDPEQPSPSKKPWGCADTKLAAICLSDGTPQ